MYEQRFLASDPPVRVARDGARGDLHGAMESDKTAALTDVHVFACRLRHGILIGVLDDCETPAFIFTALLHLRVCAPGNLEVLTRSICSKRRHRRERLHGAQERRAIAGVHESNVVECMDGEICAAAANAALGGRLRRALLAGSNGLIRARRQLPSRAIVAKLIRADFIWRPLHAWRAHDEHRRIGGPGHVFFPFQLRCFLDGEIRVVVRICVLGHKPILEGQEHEVIRFPWQPVAHVGALHDLQGPDRHPGLRLAELHCVCAFIRDSSVLRSRGPFPSRSRGGNSKGGRSNTRANHLECNVCVASSTHSLGVTDDAHGGSSRALQLESDFGIIAVTLKRSLVLPGIQVRVGRVPYVVDVFVAQPVSKWARRSPANTAGCAIHAPPRALKPSLCRSDFWLPLGEFTN